MESVYRAYFHANTSSLTHHYLVRAGVDNFSFIAINFFKSIQIAFVCIVYEFCLVGTGMVFLRVRPRLMTKGGETCRSVIKENDT